MTRRVISAALLVMAGGACNGSSRPSPAPSAPAATAATPAAAVPRKVLIEVDQMAGTPGLALEREIAGQRVSLEKIYGDAGVELTVRRDQMDLPYKEDVTLADLNNMMAAFESVPAPAGTMHVHVLVVSKDHDDPDTLGIMFDFGEEDANGLPREGFAIFADAHRQVGMNPAEEMLLTAAHELAHCFNLHHADWEGQSFRTGATIEGYSMADSVLWRLSEASRKHLAGDPEPEVWPGKNSLAFGLITNDHQRRHQAWPLEAYDVVGAAEFPTARRGTHAHAAGVAGDVRDRSRFHTPASQPLKLRLEAGKRTYQVGDPVTFTVGLHNEGPEPLKVVPLLGPEYRFLAIEVRAPGADHFEPFHPGVLADGRGARPHVLPPGESIHEEAKVFFGAEGWTFREPGTWTVRADFPAGGPDDAGFDETHGRIQSAPVQIEVVAARTALERRAKELIWGHQQGVILLIGGGNHLTRGHRQLTALANEIPTAAQAPAVKLALGTAALDATLDPVTKVESPARLAEAQRMLRSTFDAGLPALSVAKAQKDLAQELEKAGHTQDADQVRRNATRKLRGQESAVKELQQLRAEEP